MTTLHYHYTDDYGWKISAGRLGDKRQPEEIPHLFFCAQCTDGRSGGQLVLRWVAFPKRAKRPVIYCADCGRGQFSWEPLTIIHRTAAANRYARAEIKRMEATPPLEPGDDLSVTRFAESETDEWM